MEIRKGVDVILEIVRADIPAANSIFWHRKQTQSCLRPCNSIAEAGKRCCVVLHGLQMPVQLLYHSLDFWVGIKLESLLASS